MSTLTIEIDATLLHQLVKDGALSLIERGAKIVAEAGKKLSRAKISDADFEMFWSRYPRKIGKRAAKIAFQNAVKRGATPDEIQAGLDPRSMWAEASQPQYLPHPSTWLNRDGWLDERCDTTTVHDQLREALLNDTTVRRQDEVANHSTERLLSPVPTTLTLEHRQPEAHKDETHGGSDKLGDTDWTW